MVKSCWHLAQPPNWRTRPWWLSMTAYSIYLQLPNICVMEAIPLTATWKHAMLWWGGPLSWLQSVYRENAKSDNTTFSVYEFLWRWSEITLGPSPVPPCSPQGRTLLSLDLHHKVNFYVKNLVSISHSYMNRLPVYFNLIQTDRFISSAKYAQCHSIMHLVLHLLTLGFLQFAAHSTLKTTKKHC
jgi:hypothetical protein